MGILRRGYNVENMDLRHGGRKSMKDIQKF